LECNILSPPSGQREILCTGGLDAIRKEAWPSYRTSSVVRLCWELEEPKGPKGRIVSAQLLTYRFTHLRRSSASRVQMLLLEECPEIIPEARRRIPQPTIPPLPPPPDLHAFGALYSTHVVAPDTPQFYGVIPDKLRMSSPPNRLRSTPAPPCPPSGGPLSCHWRLTPLQELLEIEDTHHP
jgi:hypothetical protein